MHAKRLSFSKRERLIVEDEDEEEKQRDSVAFEDAFQIGEQTLDQNHF